MPASPKKNPKDNEPPPFENISGVILAGGKNSRYGSNKAFAKIDGTPIIEKVIKVMGAVFNQIIIVTNTPDEYAHLNLPMYGDLIKDIGPLGGIYTGLSMMSHDTGFFVACDMPCLNDKLITYMVKNMGSFRAVVPKISWKIEPLHALYDKRCLESINRLIIGGTYQIMRLFDHIPVRYVEEDEVRKFDPELISFFNVNTPKDLWRAKNG